MRENNHDKMSAWPARTKIDAAIDQAVRELMEVDTDPAFRARVFARLDRPALVRITWPAGVAAAGLAALIFALFVIRQPPADVGRTPAVAVSDSAENAVPEPATAKDSLSPAPAPAPAPNDSRAREGIRRLHRRASPARTLTHLIPAGAVVATVADAPPTGAEPDAQPSDGMALLAVDPIATSPIALSPLVIAPLAPIAAVEITPLAPRIEKH